MTDPALSPAPEAPKFPRKVRRNAAWLLVILAAAQGARSSYAHRHRVAVNDPFAFEALAGGTAAAYAHLKNGTSEAETLDSITSDVAPEVSIHTSRQSNGLVVMEPLLRPSIGARDSLVLTPGGAHLMLEGITRDLKAGDSLHLVFWFHRTGSIAVTAPVRPYGS